MMKYTDTRGIWTTIHNHHENEKKNQKNIARKSNSSKTKDEYIRNDIQL